MRNRQQAPRYAHSMRLVLGVTPEVFIWGPVPNPSGFPLKACGMTDLE
jgi:hypothetical protein